MKDLHEKERKEWLQSLMGQRSESKREMASAVVLMVVFLLQLLLILAINI